MPLFNAEYLKNATIDMVSMEYEDLYLAEWQQTLIGTYTRPTYIGRHLE